MNMLVIPAPRPADAAEPPVKNTFFWPDVDLQQLRDTLRYEGTVTAQRLRLAVKTAISEVNAELYEWRYEQMAAGFKTLPDVPAESFDGESEKVAHYFAAVSAITAATIVERYRGYDASGKKGAEVEASADEYWRDARFSISRIAGCSGCIVSLL
ncbi:head completion/stabilization protein [Candidatus Erwinia dacicola]|uniref:Head completion/stabilization protein n=1 Tax=Candidatus Erwinia dacicola TaxID=252393 RepID=A0A1E7YW85_9GAMM|nr:head completion/stabilization protein [Candidatus Erwinia dacicola]OFC60772.1 head completion/stabilization protein [Candidatus Erwinia dacicola]RAP72869.1 phage head completion family protein [Candidatus Erwinia dacicola]